MTQSPLKMGLLLRLHGLVYPLPVRCFSYRASAAFNTCTCVCPVWAASFSNRSAVSRSRSKAFFLMPRFSSDI
nr:MAG TPA: hypothetical protein [Caudoviricetes sp.]